MVKLLGIALLALTGCGALFQGTVREQDLQAWEGAPKRELQLHPFFSTLPKRVEHMDDGAEVWTYSNCVAQQEPISCNTYGTSTSCDGGGTNTTCCYNQFLVHGDQVLSYRAVGRCRTDCSLRPLSRQCSS